MDQIRHRRSARLANSGSPAHAYPSNHHKRNQDMVSHTTNSEASVTSPQKRTHLMPPDPTNFKVSQGMHESSPPKPIYNVHNELSNFKSQQLEEVKNITDFKTHALPLEQIKRILKYDEDVDIISSDACPVFSKACEMFIKQLTLRSWAHAEENKKKTLHRSDIAAAILEPAEYDFLTDFVPKDDISTNDGKHIDRDMGQDP
ncbi:hypothetical protein Fmac_018579 [Flemingia macrophylla]|uniref:Transcription factor CBF/NF-Y/archaeal histone domain-containing protein n=1 Tax=Flemingia macrophylla TaxID=520843 RepID=A0ABD1M5D2_9FABA